MINLFASNSYNISDSKFIVHGYGYQMYESWLTLTDKESGFVFSTIGNKESFVLKLHIPTELPYEINVYHSFDKNGEEIAIEKYYNSGLVELNII